VPIGFNERRLEELDREIEMSKFEPELVAKPIEASGQLERVLERAKDRKRPRLVSI
jgi:hypothetical protein